jgi:GntR family transcriptional regulator
MSILTSARRLAYHRAVRSPIPKYFTVKAILQARLERDYAQGDRLPSETALCATFGVSRITIQQALGLLEKDGAIRREQGRGTFYLGPTVTRTETRPSELLEGVMRYREGAFTRVIARGINPATPLVADRLRLAAGTPVVTIDRVGFVDYEPIIFIRASLPEPIGRKLLEDEAHLGRATLGSLLQDRHGVVIDSVVQTIGASLADPAFADHLGVTVGAAVLEGERTYYDPAGRPIYFNHAFYRADRHRFVVSLKEWR